MSKMKLVYAAQRMTAPKGPKKRYKLHLWQSLDQTHRMLETKATSGNERTITINIDITVLRQIIPSNRPRSIAPKNFLQILIRQKCRASTAGSIARPKKLHWIPLRRLRMQP